MYSLLCIPCSHALARTLSHSRARAGMARTKIRPVASGGKKKQATPSGKSPRRVKPTPKPGGVVRPRRYRPGTRALMEIRKYQKSTDLLIRKLPFARLVRPILRCVVGGSHRFGPHTAREGPLVPSVCGSIPFTRLWCTSPLTLSILFSLFHHMISRLEALRCRNHTNVTCTLCISPYSPPYHFRFSPFGDSDSLTD